MHWFAVRAVIRLVYVVQRWHMRDEESHMRDYEKQLAEVALMQLQTGLSDLMLRRHYVKLGVGKRRQQERECDGMAMEERLSCLANTLWTEQAFEKRCNKQMILQVMSTELGGVELPADACTL